MFIQDLGLFVHFSEKIEWHLKRAIFVKRMYLIKLKLRQENHQTLPSQIWIHQKRMRGPPHPIWAITINIFLRGVSLGAETQRVIYGFGENHCVASIQCGKEGGGRKVYEYRSKCDPLTCRRSILCGSGTMRPALSLHLSTKKNLSTTEPTNCQASSYD